MSASEIASGAAERRQADIELGARIAGLRSAKDAYAGRFTRSMLLLGAGVAVSLWTYLNAVFSSTGGAYYLFFGAVVYGAGNAFVAWRRYLRAKNALAELEGQYAPGAVDAAVSAWADDLLGVEDGEERTSDPAMTPLGPTIGTSRSGSIIGWLVLVAAAAVVLVPAVLIVTSGAGPGMLETLGAGGALILAVLDIALASAIGYVGWRLAFASTPGSKRIDEALPDSAV